MRFMMMERWPAPGTCAEAPTAEESGPITATIRATPHGRHEHAR
jgi:hypothetical protein